MTDRWNVADKPNGGYILSVAARAMAAAVPSHPHPFSVTAHYLRPGETGPCAIETEIVRIGKKFATMRATLSQFGKEKLVLVGTFGDHATSAGPTALAGAPPELPDPAECRRRSADGPGFPSTSTIGDRCEVLLHPDVGFMRDAPSGTASIAGWVRLADGREPDELAMMLFVDVLPPAVFEVLPDRAWVPTVELTVHVRGIPAPGWIRARMTTRHLVDGMFEEDGELWDSTGRLVAQSRQLGLVLTP